MMRSLGMIIAALAVLMSLLSLSASASDSRSLDARAYRPGDFLEWNLESWFVADIQAKRIDRLLIILAHIREGRQAEALRMLEADLEREARSFDASIDALEKGEQSLMDWDRASRERVLEVSRRLREYRQKYPLTRQEGGRSTGPER